MQKIKQQLIKTLSALIPLMVKRVERLQTQLNFHKTTDKSKYIHLVATNTLGQNLRTRTEKDLGCADALNELFLRITGKTVGGGISTLRMFNKIRRDKRFKEIKKEQDGCIIISPTGFGNGKVKHGHVGIVSGIKILSNNSLTGRWDDHLSMLYWRNHYWHRGGYPIRFYIHI